MLDGGEHWRTGDAGRRPGRRSPPAYQGMVPHHGQPARLDSHPGDCAEHHHRDGGHAAGLPHRARSQGLPNQSCRGRAQERDREVEDSDTYVVIGGCMRNRLVLRSRVPGAVFAAIAAALLSSQLRGQAVAAPAAQAGVLELGGIRPGMTAQQAYEALKARAHGAKIGIGEYSVAGLSEKPVPNSMAVFIPDTMPAQTITVWLTLPPSKQVVWAVGLEQRYSESGKMLPGTIVDALRKKYGPEVPPTVAAMALEPYWA